MIKSLSRLGTVRTCYSSRYTLQKMALLIWATANAQQQKLWEVMKEEVLPKMSFPNADRKKQWVEAADSWRLTYWDWAARQDYIDETGLPMVFTEEQVQIEKPSSRYEYENVPNPLWIFVNPMKGADGKPMPFGDPKMGENAFKLAKDSNPVSE